MLTCAIPECHAEERFLRSGTLHLVDLPREDARPVKKMVWLCPICSVNYVVQTWREPGQQIRPRQHTSFTLLEEIVTPRITGLASGEPNPHPV